MILPESSIKLHLPCCTPSLARFPKLFHTVLTCIIYNHSTNHNLSVKFLVFLLLLWKNTQENWPGQGKICLGSWFQPFYSVVTHPCFWAYRHGRMLHCSLLLTEVKNQKGELVSYVAPNPLHYASTYWLIQWWIQSPLSPATYQRLHHEHCCFGDRNFQTWAFLVYLGARL